jgi:hypothetical protein
MNNFVPIPDLQKPGAEAWDGTHVQVTTATLVDLFLIRVSSGAGLVTWTIVAPGDAGTFTLPDLTPITEDVGKLIHGQINTSVIAARIDKFEYARVRNGQLGAQGWSAYAIDSQVGAY